MYFRINALGAYCLDMVDEYAPATIEAKPVLRVLASLEITAAGEGLEEGDRLALDAYAARVSDSVWKLNAGKLLATVEQGRSVAELREFLEARSGDALPDTATRLLEDAAERCARVSDRGMVRLVECDQADLAHLIANDPQTLEHCMLAGERHLVVAMASEAAFKRGLRGLGYLVATAATG